MDTKTKILIVAILFFSVGMLAFVHSLGLSQNYFYRAYFFAVFGFVGLLFGIFLAWSLKKYILFDDTGTIVDKYPIFCIILACVGFTLFFASLLNQKKSKIEFCDDFVVIEKIRIPKAYRKPEENYIYVQFNNKKKEFVCTHKYWDGIVLNQKITICKYKSPFHFDYLILKDDSD